MSDKIIKYAGLKLTLEGAAEFVANMKKATHETTLAYEEMKRLRYEQKASGDAVGTAAAVQKQLEVVYKKQAEALKTVRLELQKYQEDGSNTAMIDKLTEKQAKLETQLARTAKQYRDQAMEAEKASNQTYQAGLKLEQQGQRLEEYGNKMLKFGATMSATVTLPIEKIAKASVNAAVELETTMANIKKVTNLGDESLGSLEQSFRNLSKEIPVSTQRLGELAEAGGRMFKQKDDLYEFTRMMADLNNTTNIVGEQGSESMMRFMSVVKTVPSEFQSLGSSIVDLGNNFTTTESDILETSKGLASAGKAAGMSTPDILGFGAALSSMDIHAEKGGSAISRLITIIEREVSSGGDKLQKFADVAGMSADQFADSWRKNPTDALLEFFAGLGQVEEKGGSLISVLDDLSIKDIRMSDVVRLLSINHEDLAKAIERSRTAWQDGSALQQEAAERYSTTAAQLEIQKNRLQDVAATIGEKLIPILIPLGEKIVDIADAFTNLDPNLQSAIINFGLFAAALGPITTIGGAVTSAIGGVAEAFGKLLKHVGLEQITTQVDGVVKGFLGIEQGGQAAAAGMEVAGAAASGASGFIGKLVGVLNGPVGIAVAAVAAAGAIAIFVSKMNESSKSAKEIADSVETLKKSFDDQKRAIDEDYGSIGLMADRLKELASVANPTNDQISLMKVYIEQLNEKVPGLGLAFDDATGKINKSADEIDKLIESTKNAAVAKVYIEQLGDAYKKLADADMKIADKKRDFDTLKNAANEIKNLLKGTGTSFDEFTANMDLYGSNIVNTTDTARQKLSELYQSMSDSAKSLMDDGGLGGVSRWMGNIYDQIIGKEDEVIGDMEKNTDALKNEVQVREDAYRSYAHQQAQDAQAIADATQKTGEQAVKYMQTATGAMVEIVSSSSDKFQQASQEYESALQSAQSSTDQWATSLIEQSDITLETMQENAKKNLETMTSWRDNLYELHGKIPEDIYEMFQRLGPAYSSVVEQLANMEEGELAPALADMVLLFADSRLQTAEELGKMPEDQAQALGAMIAWLEENGAAIPEAYKTLFENATQAASDNMKVGENAETDAQRAIDAYNGMGDQIPVSVATTGQNTTEAAGVNFLVAEKVQNDLSNASTNASEFQLTMPRLIGDAATNANASMEGTLNIAGITGTNFQGGIDSITGADPNMASAAGTAGTNASTAYNDNLKIAEDTKTVMGQANDNMASGGDDVTSTGSSKADAAATEFRNKFQQLKFYVQDIMDQTHTVMLEAGNKFASAMTLDAGDAASAFKDQRWQFEDAGSYTAEGIVSGINSKYGAVTSAARSLAYAANEAYRNALDINSPSRVMEENGRYTVEGIINGMKAMRGRLKDTAKSVADIVTGGLDFSDYSDSFVIPADYSSLYPDTGSSLVSSSNVIPSTMPTTYNVTFEYYGTTESERDQFDRFANFMESRLRRVQSGLAGA